MPASLLSPWQDPSSQSAASVGGALHNHNVELQEIQLLKSKTVVASLRKAQFFSKAPDFLKLDIFSQNWPAMTQRASIY